MNTSCGDHNRPSARLSVCLSVWDVAVTSKPSVAFSLNSVTEFTYKMNSATGGSVTVTQVSKLISIHTCDTYCRILMKFRTRDLFMMLLTICEFRENVLRKGRALLCVLMKSHLRLYRETVSYFDSKERLGEVCALRHAVQRLQFCCCYSLRPT